MDNNYDVTMFKVPTNIAAELYYEGVAIELFAYTKTSQARMVAHYDDFTDIDFADLVGRFRRHNCVPDCQEVLFYISAKGGSTHARFNN